MGLQMNITKSKRVIHLERELTILGFKESLRALQMVKKDMSGGNYIRHNGEPYYLHCVDVTLHLMNSGYREGYQDLLTASLLHDYVEDVDGASIKMIETLFNHNVASIVAKVTKDKNIDYKLDLEAMVKYLKTILSCEFATLIKLADRLCNFTTMSDSSLIHRKKQVKETEEFYLDFIKIARNTYVQHESFCYTAELVIKCLIKEYKRFFTEFEGKAE